MTTMTTAFANLLPHKVYRGLVSIFAFTACVTGASSASVNVGSREDQVNVVVSTTLESKGFSAKYRPELALTGNANSFFESDRGPRASDDFTVTFDHPIHISKLVVRTGDAKKEKQLEAGLLETSSDGNTFAEATKFSGGSAEANLDNTLVVAIRIRPSADQDQLLDIHKIDIQSDATIESISRVPRIVFDSSQAPSLAGWGIQAKHAAEASYGQIMHALGTKDFIGPNYVRLWFNPKYDGVAETGDDTIEISPSYVQGNMGDFGMVVHELTHAIQHYSQDNGAGWLVEGIADYVRFYIYEPKVPRPQIDAAKATYHDAYRTTAAFLAYSQKKYDRRLVLQLNAALRGGTYDDALFLKYTGKKPSEIWNEFIADLKSGKTKLARLSG